VLDVRQRQYAHVWGAMFVKVLMYFICRGAAHPSCASLPSGLVAVVQSYPWQCMDCKLCDRCKLADDDDDDDDDDDKEKDDGKISKNEMICCDHCDRGFHLRCLGLDSVPPGICRLFCFSSF
jgi:hypothetical protein